MAKNKRGQTPPPLAPLVKRYVGQVGEITVDETLSIPVRVVDVRHSYGRAEFKVEPINGAGVRWKAIDSVVFNSV